MLGDTICVNALVFELLKVVFTYFTLLRGQELIKQAEICAVINCQSTI